MSTPASTGYPLIPTVSDPALPADQLTLLDQLADPNVTEPQAPEPQPIGRSYLYDFQLRQLVPSPAGGPVMTYGLDSLRAWIAKTLLTDRAAAPVHMNNDYGLDGANEFLDGSTFDSGASAALEARVRDALMMHPKISEVRDWHATYTPGDDALFVSFTVVPEGDDGDPLQVTRYPLTAPGPAAEGG